MEARRFIEAGSSGKRAERNFNHMSKMKGKRRREHDDVNQLNLDQQNRPNDPQARLEDKDDKEDLDD